MKKTINTQMIKIVKNLTLVSLLLFLSDVSSAATQNKAKSTPKTFVHKTTQTQQPQLLDQIVAVVNDEVITLQDLKEHELALKSQLTKKGMQLSETTLLKQVLFQLIGQTLQLQLADQMGLEVDDADIDDAIDMIAKNRNITSKVFEKEITSAGLSREAFREQVQSEVLINRVQQKEVGNKIIISEKEIDNYMTTLTTIEQTSKQHDEMDLFSDSSQLKNDPKVRAKMRDLIYRRKFEQNLQNWLAELRDTAYVKIVDPRFSDVQ
jgi:hypothetical protein